MKWSKARGLRSVAATVETLNACSTCSSTIPNFDGKRESGVANEFRASTAGPKIALSIEKAYYKLLGWRQSDLVASEQRVSTGEITPLDRASLV